MVVLKESARSWGTPAFNDAFKAEVEQLAHEQLPLQQGLSLSSVVSGEPFRVMVISSREEGDRLRIKAGIFYSGIIAGCSCADDPTPTDVQAEYCDVEFVIDCNTGETAISLLTD